MVTPTEEFGLGMQLLGYRFIPGGAFDANGNIALPADFHLPEGWHDTVGQVAASPAWQDLLSVLSALTVPRDKSYWWCWRVGIAFRQGKIHLIVARPWSGNAQIDKVWSDHFWAVVMSSMKAYAGRRYLLPVGLGSALQAMAGTVKESSYWSREPDSRWSDDQKARWKVEHEETKWRVTTALGLFGDIAAALGGVTTSGKVLGTCLWYDPKSNHSAADLGPFLPLHQTYTAWNLRLINYWWNWGCRAPGGAPGKFVAAPIVYSASVQRDGLGVTDVAHQPWDLDGAIYPDHVFSLASGEGDDPERAVGDPWNYMLTAPRLVVAPGGEEVGEEPAQSAAGEGDDAPEPIAVAAHAMPASGGGFLCMGTIVDDFFVADDDGGDALPPTVWLPALDVCATGGEGRSRQLAGQMPAISVAMGMAGREEEEAAP
jgi:hypothetical protein